MKARYAVPAFAAGIASLAVLFPGLDVMGAGSTTPSLGWFAFLFVLTTLMGALAVLRWRRVARNPLTRVPPPPTDPRVPFVLYNEADPEGTQAPFYSGPTEQDRPARAPATPEHGRVLRLLAGAPEQALTTSAATELTGLPAERLIPVLADLTRARLVDRDAVADLWRVTEHGRNA